MNNKSQARLPDEDYETYRNRRSFYDRLIKLYLKTGKRFYDSANERDPKTGKRVPYRKPKDV